MLRECVRILKPGAKIRIATPDLRFLVELYTPKKTNLQKRYITWAVDRFLSDIAIYQDVFVINNFFKNWGHKFIYDYEALQEAMSRVRFVDIGRCNVGKSNDKNLESLESHFGNSLQEFNKLETFVVEGRKPD